ncbi:MAG TPA: uroporphyrinogen-III synthase [Steroidobacteraceae bacterium]|nr:uroporphyrinogen-III synthase [Steroidobacteraceae bacterium]
MAALEGLGVLVTRPEPQAGPLARRLASEGARVYRLPAIELLPRDDRARQRAALGPIDRFHWIVFVSANAVRFGAALLEGRRDLKLAAVGPATAAALNHAGFRVALVPQGGYDSEHLLESPEFRHVQGQRVLIVRGDSGRELLADVLAARGAEIQYAEVYERRCARPVPGAVAAVEAEWARGAIDVVTATSGELLRCLYEILSPQGRALLGKSVLLVGGARIGAVARQIGIAGPMVVASRPDDDGLVDALLKWRRHTSAP